MPTFIQMQIPPPKSWEEFEELCCSIWKEEWNDTNIQGNGRKGQKQYGIDIIGRPRAKGYWAGLQCKGKDRYADTMVTESELKEEVKKAKQFDREIKEFILVTSGQKDAKIERLAREITEQHKEIGLFTVTVLGWADVHLRLSLYPHVIKAFYPHLAINEYIDDIKEHISLIKSDTEKILDNTISREQNELDENIKLVSDRFYYILNAMNEYSNEEKYSIPKLASFMGLEKSGDLYKYFSGKEEPTFQFIEKFCKCFGVNESWMNFNEEYPFKSTLEYGIMPLSYHDTIIQHNPEWIYVVRSNSEDGETGIVIKESECKYQYFPDTYHISSHVGGTGRRQLLSFYQFTMKIYNSDLLYKCSGLTIDSEMFNLLFTGKLFPGIVEILLFKNKSDWFVDFTDVYNKLEHLAPNYKEWYGEEFVKAQLIVREQLESNEGQYEWK